MQLKHFIVLAKAGSFVKASALLFMTQPALSRSIKSLEEDLGKLLFDRVGKRIELTSFGREVLSRGQLLLDQADQIKDLGHGLHSNASGRVRLGLSSGPGAMLTAPIMIHFAKYFPNFHVDILRSNTLNLTQMLRDRVVDALVVDIRSLRPATDLKVQEMVEMKGTFMCRKEHPLAQVAQVNLDQMLKYPMASTPLSDELARILVERYGQRAHPESMVKYTSDEISHLMEVAKSSDTIVLAIQACGPELVELNLKPALNANAKFGLVTMANKDEVNFLSEIKKIMHQVFAQ
jgi:DNA-binding transcriptional LysR family regulator